MRNLPAAPRGVGDAPAPGMHEVGDAARARLEPGAGELLPVVHAGHPGTTACGRIVDDDVARAGEAPDHEQVPVAPHERCPGELLAADSVVPGDARYYGDARVYPPLDLLY